MQTWLNDQVVRERLSLPNSFELDALETYVTDVVEEWLFDLLGDARYKALLAWLELNPNGTINADLAADPFNDGLYKQVSLFIIYAAWADYIMQGGVVPTDAGLIISTGGTFEQISDDRRAALYRIYKDKAIRRATRITDYLRASVIACEPSPSLVNVRFGKAEGKTKSLFD